jgi:ferredoxin
MAMKIDPDECLSCGACEFECPTGAISSGLVAFKIDAATCNECEGAHDSPNCVEECPTGCISAADA